jgi:CubicO group peptidase (beta-lactamase class C family)
VLAMPLMRASITSILLLHLLLYPFVSTAGQSKQAVMAQSTLAGKVFTEFLNAYNSGDVNIMRRFFSDHDPNTDSDKRERSVRLRASWLADVYRDYGKLILRSIEKSTEYEMTALCQAEITEGWSRVPFKLTAESPHALLTVGFMNARRPREAFPRGRKLSETEIINRLNLYMEKVVSADKFAGVVLVAKGGKAIFKKAYGMSDKIARTPNRIDTKFNLASMNKMFTSMAIAQLAERGKLSYSDSIKKFIPDFPNQHAAEKITIHHLLTHTSGLADYFDKEEYQAAKKAAGGKLKSYKDVLPFFASDPLLFEPGEKWEYSNAGFNVLGVIIEKVSGQSYYDYVKDHILKPSGMNDTVPEEGSPAGGALSTVEDLLKFERAFRKNKLLSKKYTEIILTPRVDTAWGTKYAYGFGSEKVNGKRIVGHGGDAPSISTEFDIYLEHGYTVIVLSNYDTPAAANISGKLKELIIQE